MKVCLVVLLIGATLVAAGCSATGAAAPARPRAGGEAVPVTVSTVAQRPMPIELRVVGTVEPYATVGVRAQVGGELVAVHFQEGREVKKNDLLFTIDSRSFEAQLHQAEATLAKDTAQLDNANAQVKRYGDLVSRGIATREQIDQITTNAAALQATVRADAAAVENAKLQVQYSAIRAPIAGRTGALIIQAGNLVRANDTTPLVVINQLSPIYVSFAVPESSLADIRRYEAAGSLRVEVQTPDGQAPVERGKITFIDNAVDRSTGTIRVKGTFENATRQLWPGLFVNVLLTLKTEPAAIVVPSRAVQEAPDGKCVYVVKDNRAETRQIGVARTVGDVTVVTRGLAAGETVVTDGQLRLVSGKRVAVTK